MITNITDETPDAVLDVDADRLHAEIAHRLAYDALLVATAQREYINSDRPRGVFYARIQHRRSAA